MFLYLARHGMAASPAPEKPSRLTQGGERETQAMARALASQHPSIHQIWISPALRTIQTAEIYRTALKLSEENLIQKEALSIDGDVDDLYQELLLHLDKNLLLVSHQPTLEELSSLLVTGSDHFPPVAFPPSGLVLFEYDGQWKWRQSLDPSQLK
jgi:phosphohistidine phosphatase SixA